MAAHWWDPDGPCRPLHDLNPVRLQYVQQAISLQGKAILDIGCGGGLLSEALAREGAKVCALDMAEQAINVARDHARVQHLEVDYRLETAEQHAANHPEHYDAVTCMELLEHVPDPLSLLKACSDALKPGGQLFLSTLNRTPLSYAGAILGAEYLLKLLPVGTHDYQKFIRPSELARACRQTGLEVKDITGMRYNPFTRHAALGHRVDINYLLRAEKPA
ncbi:MAG: bifunctional 2-polyprenyl-6-hydroxyphenol methylase/3-demethylubiquinol 3-O-methyltransferase UbiG [Gammaproteobacteria bacterium]|nr:MAG: bifunctional 2-polyprenyl-6-hydroxyphenol methylase/3-demethylubiquinol 3-O-methyltransferase UbiG [Gammaproteobacteria bacterium]